MYKLRGFDFFTILIKQTVKTSLFVLVILLQENCPGRQYEIILTKQTYSCYNLSLLYLVNFEVMGAHQPVYSFGIQ